MSEKTGYRIELDDPTMAALMKQAAAVGRPPKVLLETIVSEALASATMNGRFVVNLSRTDATKH